MVPGVFERSEPKFVSTQPTRPQQLSTKDAGPANSARECSDKAMPYKRRTKLCECHDHARTASILAGRPWTACGQFWTHAGRRVCCRRVSHLRQPGCLVWRSAVHPSLFRLIRKRCTNGEKAA